MSMLPNARVRLPAGVVEASPPDEESRYGREIGTKAKVTWAWLKSKYGRQPERDQASDRDYFNGVWGKLTILVRPFDHDNQWIDGLRQEFTSDSLKDAQQYGFDLLRDMPEVRGFWISGVLDKYWQLKGTRYAIRVIDLGVYEREAYARNAKHSAHPTVTEYSGMSFDVAKGYRDALERELKSWETVLNGFPKSAMGLTAESARSTPEWRHAKQNADRLFGELRKFNTWFTREFKDELSAERRARRSGGLIPNATSYWVWVIGSDDRPKDEGPYGPHDLEGASSYARISATKGAHDRAVSAGRDPASRGFSIVRRYRRGTGERVL